MVANKFFVIRYFFQQYIVRYLGIFWFFMKPLFFIERSKYKKKKVEFNLKIIFNFQSKDFGSDLLYQFHTNNAEHFLVNIDLCIQ